MGGACLGRPPRERGRGCQVEGSAKGMWVISCQNYGPFLGTLNIRGRIIIGTQEGTIILPTNHVEGLLGLQMS